MHNSGKQTQHENVPNKTFFYNLIASKTQRIKKNYTEEIGRKTVHGVNN